jgi:hypothetical protein
MGRTACSEPQCLYSRAIPLLSLWAVRPVQSLSACTLELYLYSPYGPYGLFRASVPVRVHFTFLPCKYINVCSSYVYRHRKPLHPPCSWSGYGPAVSYPVKHIAQYVQPSNDALLKVTALTTLVSECLHGHVMDYFRRSRHLLLITIML